MAGYTRQDTTGQLANGNPIDADIFNDEYDAIEGAFNASTGHNHDGTTGGGAPIESIGPSQELEVTSAAVFPKVDNLIDHGKSTLQWKTGYYGTDVIVGQDVSVTRDVSIGRDLTVTGDATINGNLILGDAATDTVNFNADVDSDIKPETTGTYNLGSSSQEWNNLWLDGTANVDNLTVDENGTVAGTFDVTGAVGIDGDFDINTNKVTIAAATGNTTIAGTLDVGDQLSATAAIGSTSTTTGGVVVTGGVGIAENLHVGGTLDVTGDVTLDNLDVTTLDASGAVGVDGNFDVGTTQFTVDASNGNTTIAGTLDVTGDTTLTGAVTATGGVTGDLTGDVYASDGTSKVLESGTNGTDATFTGDVTGNLTGDVTSTGANTMASLTTTGDISVGGDVTVTGDLTVQGTTTTVNSTTVDIADLNITVASGAASAAAANGGGLTVAGASATLTYDSATDRWDMNKDLEVANVHADLTGDVTGNVTGNIDGIVGGTTPAAGTFTTMAFSTSISDGTTIITGFVDEDDMVSNSSSLIPTQQSVKSYVDDTLSSGSGSIAASTVSVATGSGGVDLDGGSGTGWVIYQAGTELKFKYNGVDKFKLTSAGALEVEDNVTAYGSA
jgi:hypothetical protein